MTKKIFSIFALLCMAVNGVWAQDPTIEVNPTANKNEWTFTMPAYAVNVNVEYETELTLSESTNNSDALNEWDGYEADLTLTRTLQAGGWNTFCVPFGMTLDAFKTTIGDEGMLVKELSSSELNGNVVVLNFSNPAAIVAGTPYLVKLSGNASIALPTFNTVEISKTPVTVPTTYADFVPVMSPTFLTGGDKTILFVTGGNKLTYPTADGNINGFRAYFRLKDGASMARTFNMSFDDDVTGITTVLSNEPTTGSGTYTLDGRRIEGQPTQKGVYIVNGKKTIIK